MISFLRKLFLKSGLISLRKKLLSLKESNKAVLKWDNSEFTYSKSGFKQYWELLEDVRQYQFIKMADGQDILEYVYGLFPKEKSRSHLRGLMIGCVYGRESSAVSIARTGVFESFKVIDIAENLLNKQQDLTAELGLNHILNYEKVDLNSESITGNSIYDLIWANGTIHHIQRLEGLFSEINSSLTQDGLFCMKEYVGPSFLQFTDKQIEICNSLLEGLPDDLKRDYYGRIKKIVSRPSVEEVIKEDPSEAVRSGEILHFAETFLNILDSRSCGGAILHPLLSGIAGNFEKSDADRSILKVIISLDRSSRP